jgi:hypothetical protein
VIRCDALKSISRNTQHATQGESENAGARPVPGRSASVAAETLRRFEPYGVDERAAGEGPPALRILGFTLHATRRSFSTIATRRSK